jgi:hypothetical protein
MTRLPLFALCALACGAISARAQSVLPPTPPTAAATLAPIAATPTITRGHHAYVTFDGGLLQVRADNSSLNVILRDVSRATGMVIKGGVADQRVFGDYGPAAPEAVLETLLDGTGVNIFLQESADGTPAQLNLTPRTGGVTPPSPDSAQFDAEASAEALAAPTPTPPPQPVANTTPVLNPNAPRNITPPSAPQPYNNPLGSPANTSPTASNYPTAHSVPLDSIPTPPTTVAPIGIVSAPNAPPAGTTANPAANSVTSVTTQPDGTTTSTTVTSPNGVKTPEQIYQQLLDLQKAQSKAAGTADGGSSTTSH